MLRKMVSMVVVVSFVLTSTLYGMPMERKTDTLRAVSLGVSDTQSGTRDLLINALLGSGMKEEIRTMLNAKLRVIVANAGMVEDSSLLREFFDVARSLNNYLNTPEAKRNIKDKDRDKFLIDASIEIAKWLCDKGISDITKQGIRKAIKDKRWQHILYAFHKIRVFGTAGVRGEAALGDTDLFEFDKKGPEAIILKGPFTINDETLRRLTAAVALDAFENNKQEDGVVISYDSRVQGQYFAELVARVLLAYGVKVYLFDEATPMPELSFAVTHLRAYRGILISASHNKREFNGFKLVDEFGAQLNPGARNSVIAKLKDVEYSNIKQVSDLKEAPQGRLAILGENIHQSHREHVQHFLKQKEELKKWAKALKVCYVAFYGAGRKTVPKILSETGFSKENIRRITKEGADFDRLDGLFPEFQSTENKLPDPGDPEAWEKVLQYFVSKNKVEDLSQIDIFLGTDPDADRCGIVCRISADEIPTDEQVIEYLELKNVSESDRRKAISEFRRLMGIVYVLPEKQQKEYGFGGFKLLTANDAWTALLRYQLDCDKNKGGIKDRERKFIIKSHVTTDALAILANKFGITAVNDYVGMSLLADKVRDMRDKGHINIGMYEESNGYTLGGAKPSEGELMGESGHTLEKDGSLAALLLSEIAAYEKAQGKDKSLSRFIDDNIYLDPETGFFPTANQPLEFEGIEGESKKMDIMHWTEKLADIVVARAKAGNPMIITGRPILGVKKFGQETEKENDYKLYPNCPIEGVRFYFGRSMDSFKEDMERFNAAQKEIQQNTKEGIPNFENPVDDYITIRPSGTENKLRFYIQAKINGLTKDNLIQKKLQTYAEFYKMMNEWKQVTQNIDVIPGEPARPSSEINLTKEIGIETIFNPENLSINIDTSDVNTVYVITGGGDCAGINDMIANAIGLFSKDGMQVVGIKEAFIGAADPNFEDRKMPTLPEHAETLKGLASTEFESAREDPFTVGKTPQEINNKVNQLIKNLAGALITDTGEAVTIEDILEGTLITKSGNEYDMSYILQKSKKDLNKGFLLTKDGRRMNVEDTLYADVVTKKGKIMRMQKPFKGMIVTGGDDHLTVAWKLHIIGIRPVVAIPKSMDNDFWTQMLGFHTAFKKGQEEVWASVRSAVTHHRACVIEIFGRSKGHVAFRSSEIWPEDFKDLPKDLKNKIVKYGPSMIILLPERATSLESILRKAVDVMLTMIVDFSGRLVELQSSTIEVAEGFPISGKDPVLLKLLEIDPELKAKYMKIKDVDPLGNPKFAGIGDYIIGLLKHSKKIAEFIGDEGLIKKVKYLEKHLKDPYPETIRHELRGAAPDVYDEILARGFAGEAYELINKGESGFAVTLDEGASPYNLDNFKPRAAASVIALKGVDDVIALEMGVNLQGKDYDTREALKKQHLDEINAELRRQGVFWKEHTPEDEAAQLVQLTRLLTTSKDEDIKRVARQALIGKLGGKIQQALSSLIHYRDMQYLTAVGSTDTAEAINAPEVLFTPGHDAYETMRNTHKALIAVNIVGFNQMLGHMLAAMEKNAGIIFEVARSQLDYAIDEHKTVAYIKEVAECIGFDKPLILHGDHIQYEEKLFNVRAILKEEYEKAHGKGSYKDGIDIEQIDIGILNAVQQKLRENAIKERNTIKGYIERLIKAGFTSIAIDASTVFDEIAGDAVLDYYREHGTPAERLVVELEEGFELPLEWGADFLKLDPNSEVGRERFEYVKNKVISEMQKRGRSAEEIAKVVKDMERAFGILYKKALVAGFPPSVFIAAYDNIMTEVAEAAIGERLPIKVRENMSEKRKLLLLPTSNAEETKYQLACIDQLVEEYAPGLIGHFGKEIEVGHVDKKVPNPRLGGKLEPKMTHPIAVRVMGEYLKAGGSSFDLIATNNGSGHGTDYDKNTLNPISQVGKISPWLTEELQREAKKFGAAIVQHGTSGSDMEEIADLGVVGVIKFNIATNYQQIILNILSLMDDGLTPDEILQRRQTDVEALVKGLHEKTREKIKQLAASFAKDPSAAELKEGDSLFVEFIKRAYAWGIKKKKIKEASTKEDISILLAKEFKRAFSEMNEKLYALGHNDPIMKAATGETAAKASPAGTESFIEQRDRLSVYINQANLSIGRLTPGEVLSILQFMDEKGHMPIGAFDQGTFIEWTDGNKEKPTQENINKATIFRLRLLYYYVANVMKKYNRKIGALIDRPALEALNDVGPEPARVSTLIGNDILPLDFLEVVKGIPIVAQMEETRGKRGVVKNDDGGVEYYTATRRDRFTVEQAVFLGAKMIKSNVFLYCGSSLLGQEYEFNKRQWEFIEELAEECRQFDIAYVSEILFMKSEAAKKAPEHNYLYEHAKATLDAARKMKQIEGITFAKLAHPFPEEDGWKEIEKDMRQSYLQKLAQIGMPWFILSAGEGWETFNKKVQEAAEYGGIVGMLIGRTPIKNVVTKVEVGGKTKTLLKPTEEVIEVLQGEAVQKMEELAKYLDASVNTVWQACGVSEKIASPSIQNELVLLLTQLGDKAPKTSAAATDSPKVLVHENREIMGDEASKQVWDIMLNLLETTDRKVSAVLASAPSQVEFLAGLVEKINTAYTSGKVSLRELARIHIFHLDQYTGLHNKPQEYREKCDFAIFLEKHFFSLLTDEIKQRVAFHPIRQVGKGLEGDALLQAAQQECARYLEEEIEPVTGKDGKVDIVVFGIGDENGHLAFIEPENANIDDDRALIPVKVHPEQQVSDGMFRKTEDVPEWAISMTLHRLILGSDYMVGVIPAPSKAISTRNMLEGPISPECPSSYVRIKDGSLVTVNLTKDSAKYLSAKTSAATTIPENHKIVPLGEEKFLIVNVGSTSVKMELQDAQGNLLAEGKTKGNIGDVGCVFNVSLKEKFVGATVPMNITIQAITSHNDALEAFVTAILPWTGQGRDIQAAFYKTVYGGPNREGVFVLDEDTLNAMGQTYLKLAPVHNYYYTLAATRLKQLLPNTIHLGRFETATHIKNTPESTTTSLPYRVADALGLKAVGFHGASFAYLLKKIPGVLTAAEKKLPENLKVIGFHIGGSSSVCMAENGVSLETSMMGTPESGFTQGDRITGANVNPQMVEYIVEALTKLCIKYYSVEITKLYREQVYHIRYPDELKSLVDEMVTELVEKGTIREKPINYEKEDLSLPPRFLTVVRGFVTDVIRQRVNRMLVEESGLQGIAGIGTGDLEKILEAADKGNEMAGLAYKVLVAEARHYLGAYIMKLGGEVGVIAFTAGTGENCARFRKDVIGDGKFFGWEVIKLDNELNEQTVKGKEGIISSLDSRVTVMVIKANEAATLVEECLAKYRQIIAESSQGSAKTSPARTDSWGISPLMQELDAELSSCLSIEPGLLKWGSMDPLKSKLRDTRFSFENLKQTLPASAAFIAGHLTRINNLSSVIDMSKEVAALSDELDDMKAVKEAKLEATGTVILNEQEIPQEQRAIIDLLRKSSPHRAEFIKRLGVNVVLAGEYDPQTDRTLHMIVISKTKLAGLEDAKYLDVTSIAGAEVFLPVVYEIVFAKGLLLYGITKDVTVKDALSRLYRKLARIPLKDELLDEFINTSVFKLLLPKPEAIDKKYFDELQRASLQALIAA